MLPHHHQRRNFMLRNSADGVCLQTTANVLHKLTTKFTQGTVDVCSVARDKQTICNSFDIFLFEVRNKRPGRAVSLQHIQYFNLLAAQNILQQIFRNDRIPEFRPKRGEIF
jgi:hypothetical protein